MTTGLIRFKTSDGYELHGMLWLPNAAPVKAILHVHGLAGNFYENRFVHAIAADAISRGFAFLSFNNRGHDYISDSIREIGSEIESVRIGGAYEKFGDCLLDIDAALGVITKHGIKQVVLEGHSSGANKVVYYQSQRKNPCIRGLVLISPCDDVGLQFDATKERAGDLLLYANSMVAQGKGNSLMPDGSFFTYPMSAATFVDYFSPGSAQDVFPYRNPEADFSALGSIHVPILVTFGEAGDYVLQPLEDTCSLLKKKALRTASFGSAIISGASHTYLGREDMLATKIIDWASLLTP